MDFKKVFLSRVFSDFKMLESEDTLENSKSEMLEQIEIHRCWRILSKSEEALEMLAVSQNVGIVILTKLKMLE